MLQHMSAASTVSSKVVRQGMLGRMLLVSSASLSQHGQAVGQHAMNASSNWLQSQLSQPRAFNQQPAQRLKIWVW
jgi:hypothetical protein